MIKNKVGWQKIHSQIWANEFGSYLVEWRDKQIIVKNVRHKASIFTILYQKGGIYDSKQCFQLATIIHKHLNGGIQ